MQNKLEISKLAKDELVLSLKKLVATERKVTADILVYIREVERRRLYFDYSCTSLFDFLLRELGYTRASAQRRIDSARLLAEIPEMKTDLESGALNLSQVSLLAQSIRQKQKETPAVKILSAEKTEILELIKDKDFETSQKIIAQKLDIEVKTFEKKRVQQDESVRYEVTLSKEQNEILTKARELSSHVLPGSTFNELIVLLAEEYIKRKNPAAPKRVYSRKDAVASNKKSPMVSSNSELNLQKNSTDIEGANDPKVSLRRAVSAEVRRNVFRRDQSCQWRDHRERKKCGSKFQLELDHVQPVWAGGRSDADNLQLLCRQHNQYKYRREAGISSL